MPTSVDVEGWGVGSLDREGACHPLSVTLSWNELLIGALVGVEREIFALRHRLKQRNRDSDLCHATFEDNIQGACAEMAVAKALDKFFPTNFEVDISNEWEVRHSVRKDASLIVRMGDSDVKKFVLVVGQAPKFRIVGWKRGSDAKKSQWLRAPNVRPPAYFVPQKELESI